MHRFLILSACVALLAACGTSSPLTEGGSSGSTGGTTASSTGRASSGASSSGGTSGSTVTLPGGQPATTGAPAGSSSSSTTSSSASAASSTASSSSGGASTGASNTGSSTGATDPTTSGSSTGSTGSGATSTGSTSSGATSTGSTSGGATSTTTTGGTTGGTVTNGAVPSIGGCQLFPADNVWNTDISNYPLSTHSEQWVAAIGAGTGMHPDFGTVWNGAPNGVPFIVVPESEPLLPISFNYASQSDPGPYPAPLDAPIEGGPSSSGDRHVIVVQQGTCKLYEIYDAHPGSGVWTAGSGAIWDLNQNQQRPDGWTSADASGMAILPGLVKYDEVASGVINHAIRVTAESAQSAYIYPATHSDGQAGSDPTHPPMGARFRLKASFDESGYPTEVQVILRAMKKYGIILADTGGNWSITGSPDSRWSDNNLASLGSVTGSNFEAVENGAIHAY